MVIFYVELAAHDVPKGKMKLVTIGNLWFSPEIRYNLEIKIISYFFARQNLECE